MKLGSLSTVLVASLLTPILGCSGIGARRRWTTDRSRGERRRLGRLAPDTPVDFVVGLSLRRPEALHRFVAARGAVDAALDPSDFADQYAPLARRLHARRLLAAGARRVRHAHGRRTYDGVGVWARLRCRGALRRRAAPIHRCGRQLLRRLGADRRGQRPSRRGQRRRRLERHRRLAAAPGVAEPHGRRRAHAEPTCTRSTARRRWSTRAWARPSPSSAPAARPIRRSDLARLHDPLQAVQHRRRRPTTRR